VIWESDRAAALVGAAYYKDGLAEEQILEIMQDVVASGGDVDELAHDLWAPAASLH
jgi:hypothetical protein